MSKEEPKPCTYDPLIELMSRLEGVKVSDSGAGAFQGLSIEQILQKHIVDGIRKDLPEHLETALEQYEPLAIINDILLAGMKTVGELFGSGKMQLPFVLKSAEVMKAAVDLLEPHMEKVEGSERGSILLATVAGDVHDIGKNLVDIILSNNGYRVVNIGIKQPINNILEQAQEHRCDVIGMSGLLVKSTVIMKDNLLEMNERGLSQIPVILGGAALTRGYVEHDLRNIYKGHVHYAQDAFEGLNLMERISRGDDAPEPLPAASRPTSHRLPDQNADLYIYNGVRSETPNDNPTPEMPFYGVRTATDINIDEVYPFINPIALWRGQWQFRRDKELSNPEFDQWLQSNAKPIQDRLQANLKEKFQPKVAWGYFWCQSDGNDLILFDESRSSEILRFNFPRQAALKRLCLSDFARPLGSPEFDFVGFQIVTVGDKISQYERSLFESGDYQEYLYVHGMGVETAEALAEYWHRQMRTEMGIVHQDPPEMKQIFGVKYQGCRYSFGYPACPNLEDQVKLFELLRPESIGIELTDQFMLSPEQSTSAIIFYHPFAKYFNV